MYVRSRIDLELREVAKLAPAGYFIGLHIRFNVDMKAMGPAMEIDGVDNQVVEMDFSANLH
jgi:hypothetical protein